MQPPAKPPPRPRKRPLPSSSRSTPEMASSSKVCEPPTQPRKSERIKVRRRTMVRPRVLLDHTAFPHIMDAILEYSPRASLIAFRGTSKAYRDRADRLLGEHISMSVSTTRAAYTVSSIEGRMPLFKPLRVRERADPAKVRKSRSVRDPVLASTRVLDIYPGVETNALTPDNMYRKFRKVDVLRIFHDDKCNYPGNFPVRATTCVVFIDASVPCGCGNGGNKVPHIPPNTTKLVLCVKYNPNVAEPPCNAVKFGFIPLSITSVVVRFTRTVPLTGAHAHNNAWFDAIMQFIAHLTYPCLHGWRPPMTVTLVDLYKSPPPEKDHDRTSSSIRGPQSDSTRTYEEFDGGARFVFKMSTGPPVPGTTIVCCALPYYAASVSPRALKDEFHSSH